MNSARKIITDFDLSCLNMRNLKKKLIHETNGPHITVVIVAVTDALYCTRSSLPTKPLLTVQPVITR